jgi:hypothetical protein
MKSIKKCSGNKKRVASIRGRDSESISPDNVADMEKVSYKTFEFQSRRMSRSQRTMNNIKRQARTGRTSMFGSTRRKKI